MSVHIADVGHFAPPGGALDREARKRGTSVYLPQRVLPMFPEMISNSLASLQQGRVRYVKSVLIDFTPAGPEDRRPLRQRRHPRPQAASPTSRCRRSSEAETPPAAEAWRSSPRSTLCLLRMRDLAMILRKRRLKRGALELNMPEAELEYDEQGRVTGGHFRKHDVSHQIIEEFMLAANEAVAEHLAGLDVPFLRRVHPAPEPTKLKAFAEFARSLGYKMRPALDRFALQRILEQSAGKPDVYAVHYALLRSLKQAVYSPADEGHYALASDELLPFHLADPPLSRPDRPSPARPAGCAPARPAATRRSWRRWASTAARWSAGPRRPSASWSS